jgi:hypothetical protein
VVCAAAPLLDAAAGLVALVWLGAGWRGVAMLADGVAGGLVALWRIGPGWFARLVSGWSAATHSPSR